MLLDNKTKTEDNEHYKVCDFIKGNTENGSLDIVTGYFSVNALALLKDEINTVEKFRLILGNIMQEENQLSKVVDLLNGNTSISSTLLLSTSAQKAVELLPEKNQPGRIDRYSAMGLLSKVYLTKAGYGQNGTRNQADLDKAAFFANEVIEKSGRALTPNYADIFRLKNNIADESLIAWRWTVSSQWTSQNTLQSDLGLNGFSEFADSWGTWVGITIDLQNLFGEDARNKTSRVNTDARRQATMMMLGDKYDYFWADKGGFTYN